MKVLIIGTFENPPPERYRWNFKTEYKKIRPDCILLSLPIPMRLYLEFVYGKEIYTIDHEKQLLTKIEKISPFDEKASDVWFVYKEFNDEFTYENIMTFLNNTR